MIEFKQIYKAFGDQHVLRGFSLRVERGEVMFIIGTSGVGKSVAIKHLIGLLQPDRGEVLLDGEVVSGLNERNYYPIRKRCGMVFQHSTLFDSLTLLENVALPFRKHRRLKAKQARQLALEKLEVVQLSQFAYRYPAELGNGIKKRAAIARTLALDPDFILFDEPTTGLDPISARRVDALVRELKALNVTSIVVSHDLTSVFGIADRIAFVYQGVVHLLGTPETIRSTEDPIVQQFINGRSQGPMITPGF